MFAFGDVVSGGNKAVGERNPMGLEEEYRKHAAASLEMASKQPDNAEKGRLLLMAEAWLDLADRIPGGSKSGALRLTIRSSNKRSDRIRARWADGHIEINQGIEGPIRSTDDTHRVIRIVS